MKKAGSPQAPKCRIPCLVPLVPWERGKEDTRDPIFVPWQQSSLKTCLSSAFWIWHLDVMGKIVLLGPKRGFTNSLSLHGDEQVLPLEGRTWKSDPKGPPQECAASTVTTNGPSYRAWGWIPHSHL